MIPPFADFFEAVWGHAPYPWQSRLADTVRADGWPSVLDLPTGSGKTAVVDIALYDLIRDGGRTRPRRIVLVVDRRVIVSQVAERARRLRSRIEAGAGPLGRVRDTLREMVGEHGPLLECPTLRGGMVQNDDWARYPHVPVLAASTVDQVGSRLLFRGYGVSRSMQPVHAGLVGCDTLFLLDEVHLSRPFADLLAQIRRLRSGDSALPDRSAVVQLSATPGIGALGSRFRLNEEDRLTPRLTRILEAGKPADIEEVRVRARAPEADKRAAVAERAAELALELAAEGRQAVAVVVNRVDTARRTWEALGGAEEIDCELITGRMRPLDQEALVQRITPRVAAGRGEGATQRPIVVVATQCIEAGADYDFDGLITECASLDALRQRFGRLDRRGLSEERTGLTARAVILARSDIKSMAAPVYGDALRNTWEWLDDLADEEGQVDFGIQALAPHADALGDDLREYLAPRRESAVVLPTYLDQWSQTNPRPHADPDVSVFLHGIPQEGERVVEDIRVVWRADITSDRLKEASADATGSVTEELIERLSAVPPASLEGMALPVWAVKRWLAADGAGEGEDDLADVEGVSRSVGRSRGGSRPVVLWRGLEDSRIVDSRGVPPGSTVVVPAALGGIGTHGTFDPVATEAVSDLGDVAQLRQRGRGVLRIDSRVWPLLVTIESMLKEIAEDATQDPVERMLESLADVPLEAEDVAPSLVSLLEALGSDPILRQLDDAGWMAVGRRRVVKDAAEQEAGTLVTGVYVDDESFLAVSSLLADHVVGVAAFAEFFARRLDLPEEVIVTLRWAGLLHDIGKIDPRFQCYMYGGDEISARFGEPLAKSMMPWHDRPSQRRARERAGYPTGQRHELVSLDMIEGSASLASAVKADGGDWELLLHLVAAHHGWCRPLAPAVTIPEDVSDPVEWSVDGHVLTGTTAHDRSRIACGIVRRFFALVQRYGWHELAYLEAILRLSDHRRSEQEDIA